MARLIRPQSPTSSSAAITSFLFLVFSVVPLLAEVLNLKGFYRYKIQPNVRLLLSQIVSCYKDVMKMFFLVIGPLQLVSYPTVKMIGITTGLPLPSIWEFLSQLLVYFLIEDYSNYWLHRWLHRGRGYEKIHKVHHEFTAPIAFAAPYAHWAGVLISRTGSCPWPYDHVMAVDSFAANGGLISVIAYVNVQFDDDHQRRE